MTMPSPTTAPATTPPAPAPAGPAAPQPEGLTTKQKWQVAGAVAVGIVILAALVAAVVFLASSPAQAAVWRDIFIIFMALETFVIGAALIVLIAQLAVLTNLLKHEIRPILESTNETVNTLRGTALFVSENLTEPIIQLNGYVAALEKVVSALGALFSLGRKK